jgi:hypothetical protein
MKNENKKGIRILGRQVGEELTLEEMGVVSGGGPLTGNGVETDNPPHGGTCTNEADCD